MRTDPEYISINDSFQEWRDKINAVIDFYGDVLASDEEFQEGTSKKASTCKQVQEALSSSEEDTLSLIIALS